MNGVIYVRYSSDHQREESIEGNPVHRIRPAAGHYAPQLYRRVVCQDG